MDNILEIKGLEKNYPKFNLGPIDLSIPKGSIVGFIGENGAGKSTTIKIILDLVHKSAGSVEIFGKEVNGELSNSMKEDIGVVLDELHLPVDMKVKAASKFAKMIYKNWNDEKYSELVSKFDIPMDKKIKELSRGTKMKLSIAIAMSHNAKLLILDEATSGLDPVIREEILDLFLDFIQDENKSVFCSSHILSDLEKVADHIAFIHKGKLLFMEEKDNLYEGYALYSCSHEEANNFPKDVVIGRKTSSFGERLLLDRNKVGNIEGLEKPNIEDIMLFFVKEV
ncbi:ABC transporter ATP-binding protein [Miniphocaeibacter massiliensis]|uniref:ABC transporter ATP-binding protein n=1 Tax=Miniphocaeibacter massiliensis TaxID=2041841 RepID=UPI000C1B8548|nr:ABC transporter ATP-binding protein [Miniphocaeibacter massiliensis]